MPHQARPIHLSSCIDITILLNLILLTKSNFANKFVDELCILNPNADFFAQLKNSSTTATPLLQSYKNEWVHIIVPKMHPEKTRELLARCNP